MLNNNITNEEEQCIDNILSNGLEEIKDITLLDSQHSGRSNNNFNQLNMTDLKRKTTTQSDIDYKYKRTAQPKSNALKALINQLKQNTDYGFNSEEEGNKENEQITLGNLNDNNKVIADSNIRKKINKVDLNINIDKIEKNSKTFLDMKDEMTVIQQKIENLNHKISRSVNPTQRNYFKIDTDTKRLKKNTKPKIKKKRTVTNNVNTSVCSMNVSTHSDKLYTSNTNSYKEKYDDLKEKYELQKEKIKAEEMSIKSIQMKIKQINKKNSNFNKLVEYNKKLFAQEELLKRQIIESEKIRKEQSKLIRSLQREIDMFRADADTNNYSNIAEMYQQMKESLLKSNISQ